MEDEEFCSDEFQKSIRRLEGEQEAVEQAEHIAYRAHLESIAKPESTLRKFFYYDFFHDSVIENLRLEDGGTVVALDMTALNCQDFTGPGPSDFTYVYVPFRCRFGDVRHFSIDYRHSQRVSYVRGADGEAEEVLIPVPWGQYDVEPDEDEDFDYERSDDMVFIHSRVDTSPLIPQFTDRTMHSLVIDTACGHEARIITIVFGYAVVEAEEPLAFRLMQNDPRYRLHLGGED